MKILPTILIIIAFCFVALLVQSLKEVSNQCWIYNQAEESNNQALFEDLKMCLESKIQCSKDFNESAENFSELFLELTQCYGNK